MSEEMKPTKMGLLARFRRAAQTLITGNGNDPQLTQFFGPGQPMKPVGPDSLVGRQFDFPVGQNFFIQSRPQYEGIGFDDLRLLAEHHDVTRLLIETRKDQMEALDWTIRPVGEIRKNKQNDPDAEKRCEESVKFFKFPDGITPFSAWLRQLLEDLLVIDAPTIYCNHEELGNTRFEVIDGATIKPLIDDFGRRPLPPSPAFQQIIKGMPAFNYTAEDIIYMPRNPRPHKVYGFSPVQQIVMLVNIALRRQVSQLNYFTDGNVPDAFISTPKEWTPEQIASYQNAWDALFEGNLATRRRAKFIPGDSKVHETMKVTLKDEFDDWLARIACYAFSISPQGFVSDINRATAQTAKQTAEQEGLAPLMRWVKMVMDIMLQRELGQIDLEFVWEDRSNQDPSVKSSIIDTKLRNGTMTINEAREEEGREPFGEEGNVPMIFTGSGPVPLKQAIEGPRDPFADMMGGMPGDEGDDGSGKKPPTEEDVDDEEVDNPPPGAAGAEEKAPAAKARHSLGKKPRLTKALINQLNTADKGTDFKGSLYIARPLINSDDLIQWAKDQGFTKTLQPDDFHATIVFSRESLVWNSVPPAERLVTVIGGKRTVERLGDKGAVVLRFDCARFTDRHRHLRDLGASWDFESYQPHVTISYAVDPDFDIDAVVPFDGQLVFGAEAFAPVDDGWSERLTEKRGVGKSSHRPFGEGGCPGHGPIINRALLADSIQKARKRGYVVLRPPKRNAKEQKQREDKLYAELVRLFKKAAKKAAKQLRPALAAAVKSEKVQKAGSDDIDFDSLNLDELEQLMREGLITALADTSAQAGREALARLGAANNSELVDQVNDLSEGYAERRAAELVGKRVLPNGRVIDNPDARWSIPESTREMLKRTIREGMANGHGVDELTDDIEDSFAFSPERARMIARTEVSFAHNRGAMEGYKAAREEGVKVKKIWIVAHDPCDECIENADEGEIDLDDEFPSGDLEPPAHPNCMCAVAPAVSEDDLPESYDEVDPDTYDPEEDDGE